MARICVFCGAARGADPAYAARAVELGRAIAGAGHALVFGGGRVGLMGVVADSVLETGGDAVGVIPQQLVDRELAHDALTDLRVVGSMHERKALMAELSDAFVALPGGLGTMEETFEVLSWSQLGLHRKPVALLDVEGYFAPLARFLDQARDQGFLAPEHRALVIVEGEMDELLARVRAFEPLPLPQWLRDVELT